MQIDKLRTKNFKCYKNWFEINFNKDMNILVGNNGAGKTTILEAINLVLTGYYKGKNIKNNISQYLFNNDVVKEYINEVSDEKSPDLPEIIIEAYLSDDIPEFLGDNNSLKLKNKPGVKLSIHFDEAYGKEYSLLDKKNLISLPLEYYTVTWESFSRQTITSRSIPLKASYINANASRNGSNLYVDSVVKNMLSDSDIVNISQVYRRVNDRFLQESNIHEINNRIREGTGNNYSITVNYGNNDSWWNNIATQLDDVIYDNIGQGNQCMMKTDLAIKNIDDKKRVLLFEEPECHLSNSYLNRIIYNIEQARDSKQVFITTHSSFVANKLGLSSIIMVNQNLWTSFSSLKKDTFDFFKKISGYDTLRMILSKKVVLVEGDSDELVLQRAYLDRTNRLPIHDNIDIISVGTSFLRFLEIAEKLNINTIVVKDNDGKVSTLKNSFKEYLDENQKEFINICYDIEEHDYNGKIENYNNNTLEPCIIRANSLHSLNKILDKNFENEDDLCLYMKNNKTSVALAIFNNPEKINYPQYINDAIDLLCKKDD
ncbi:ATP-dependent nuclease [Mycoplasma bradburyae]|uniref:AAA family ATPase n=1 Tax=Mycoplasma bradburyae TaxID=2963128 RepID=A0ABT5GBH3_9MOLU|nr:AAA family ATPase [Mycoplasma bradburyae]MDC4182244.1 AAA family ATPase [Mycoplasma bradburyae]UTS70067.1 AAA family ATPase [Mycoplasma bradburyae]